MYTEKRKIIQVGNSTGITLNEMGLAGIRVAKGDSVEVTYKNNSIVIKKSKGE